MPYSSNAADLTDALADHVRRILRAVDASLASPVLGSPVPP
jgi:hypothetical protein